MAVDGGPKPPQRMPQASPDTTQPLETTRRTALATAGFCVCGCGAYLATSEDETFLDAYKRVGMEPFKSALYPEAQRAA